MKTVNRIIAILFTPHTPRLINITAIMIICSSFFCTISKGQETHIYLPEQDTLELALKKYHNRLWQAERLEYINLNKKKWWYYLPSFGIQFGLPSVTFGTGTLATIDRDKVIKKQKLKSIDLNREVEFNKQLTELHSRYAILEVKVDRLKTHEIIRDKERALFDIYLESLSKHDMTPEEFKLKELAYFRSDLAYDSLKDQIVIELLELANFAHWGELRRPVWFDINECEVMSRKD